MSRSVFLHVGAPKTGTTYLQDRLTLNARTLAAHGVHFPTGSPLVSPALFQFRAALDLLGQDWGGPPGHAAGSWDALVKRVRRSSGTVVVSHEILAPASPEQVARVKRDLGGADLHIVYSARDLARQVPAAWQESIKQGRKWSYRRYLAKVQRGEPWLQQAFDLPRVLDVWGAGLAPDRVHVVTVPPATLRAPGQPRERGGGVLWSRFCHTLGIRPEWAPRDSDRTNPSLGIAETQLIRKLNRRMGRKTRRQAEYDYLVREVLAQRTLVHRPSAPVRMPPQMLGWAESEAERWIDWIRTSGVDVVGDLEDLRPTPAPADQPWSNPDKVPSRNQLDVALDALAAMTGEAARRPDPDQRLIRRVRAHAERLRGHH